MFRPGCDAEPEEDMYVCMCYIFEIWDHFVVFFCSILCSSLCQFSIPMLIWKFCQYLFPVVFQLCVRFESFTTFSLHSLDLPIMISQNTLLFMIVPFWSAFSAAIIDIKLQVHFLVVCLLQSQTNWCVYLPYMSTIPLECSIVMYVRFTNLRDIPILLFVS